MGERRRVRLGEFEIIERIGSGGMGQVFKAMQVPLDRVVALKLLPKSMARDRALVERLYREAKAAAKIIHPDVVQIYSVGEEHGVPYFAMEYVEGDDLEQRLSRGDSFTLQEVIDIIAGVAMALSAAAEHGIVHRDIKPGNIMIDRNGVVKVTDFGLAKPATTDALNITQAGFIVGTPTYMSPEQADGTQVDGRSDIYSLGIVFYELLTGAPPYVADSPAALIYKHVHEAPTPPSEVRSEIPPEVGAVVLKCLEKKPEDRYETPGEMLGDLVEARRLVGEDVSSTIVFDAAQARKWAGVTPAVLDTHVRTRGEEEPVEGRGGLSLLTSLAAAVAAAAVIGAVGLGMYLYRQGFFGGGRPQPVGPPTGVTRPHTTEPGKEGPKAVAVDFGFLRDVLPDGTVVTLVQQGGEMPIRLGHTSLRPGTYTVKLDRNHYLPKVVKVVVGKNGFDPKPDPGEFVMKPVRALSEAYEKGLALLKKGEYEKAIGALEVASGYDATYRDVQKMLAEARSAVETRKSAQDEQWLKAADFFKHALYEDAAKLLKDIPPQNPHFAEAQNLLSTAEDRLAELARLRTACEEAVKKGDTTTLKKELAAFSQIARSRPQDKAFLERHEKDLAELERLWSEYGETASDVERHRLLKAVLDIAPETADARRKISTVGDRLSERQEAEGLFGSAKSAFSKGEYGESRRYVRLSFEIWPEGKPESQGFDKERKDLSENARRAAIERDLKARFVTLRKALIGEEADIGAFATGIEIASLPAWKSDLAIEALDLSLVGFEEGETELRVKGRLSFRASGPCVPVRAAADYIVTFTPGGYLIKAMTLEGAEAGVSKEVPQGALVKGRVVQVKGPLITVRVEKASQLPIGAGFIIYGEGRVYTLPMSDRVFLAEPCKLAEGRAISRGADTVIVDVGKSVQGVADGAVAVYDPKLQSAKTPPRALSAAPDKNSAHTAEAVTVSVEVANLEGRPVAFRWQANGGALVSEATLEPRVVWVPPADAGRFTVKADLVYQGEVTSSVEAVIESKGPRGTLPREFPEAKDTTILVGGGYFRGLSDLSFDAGDKPVLIDGKDHNLLVYSPGFRKLLMYRPLGRYQPAKAVLRRSLLYQLDEREGLIRVLRVEASAGAKAPREPEALLSIGRKGSGNGALAQPTDFAFLPEGNIAVVDAGAKALVFFTADGRFLYSVGSPGKGKGQMDNPIAIEVDTVGDCHVLDAGRGVILTYRGVNLTGETMLSERDTPAMDVAFSPAQGAWYVLYQSGLVSRFKDGKWLRVGMPGDALGRMKDPVGIAADHTGSLYVVHHRGAAIERLGGDGGFTGRLGGQQFGRPSKVACAPDGYLYLLDKDDRVVFKIDPAGFLVKWFGGIKVLGKPVDVAVSASGDVMVLDEKAKQILVFDAETGRPKGSIGKGGRLPATEIVVPVDASPAGEATLVLQYTNYHHVHIYSDKGALVRSFPQKTDPKLSSVMSIAGDAQGRIFVAQREKPVRVYDAEGAVLGEGKARLRQAADAEGSSDGTVLLLDNQSNALYATLWEDGALLELAVDLKDRVRNPLDIACDRYGGVYVLASDNRLTRLSPAW